MKRWIIYGKALKDFKKVKKMKRFAALDRFGNKAFGLQNAYFYPTKEAAENMIKSSREHGMSEDMVAFEIRHVNVPTEEEWLNA